MIDKPEPGDWDKMLKEIEEDSKKPRSFEDLFRNNPLHEIYQVWIEEARKEGYEQGRLDALRDLERGSK
jgi:hypothetical protein